MKNTKAIIVTEQATFTIQIEGMDQFESIKFLAETFKKMKTKSILVIPATKQPETQA